MTVADVLTDRGIDIGRRHGDDYRTRCPVHRGENETSFSHRDVAWICFSCGAHGGVADLIAVLDGTDRSRVLRQLRGKRRRTPGQQAGARRARRKRVASEAAAKVRLGKRQVDFEASVDRFHDLAADCELIEGIWQRDRGERSALVRRALDGLAGLYARRDQAGAVMWELWARAA